ncbi:MAG: DUF4810 domain-containing protein [Aquabacterium sp.]|nr:DUF4810 domain-containing protein [Aquabacterium sp.]
MSRRPTTQGLLVAITVAALTGCAQAPKPLYMWEAFPRQQYDVLRRDGSSADEQIQALEQHAAKARGEGAALPPGFRAHLGMLYLSVGQADKARDCWLAEQQAFPESTPYMNQLLKRLEAGTAGSAAASKNGSPT